MSPALADPVRTINMTQVLLNSQGEPARDPTGQTPDDPSCTKCRPLTVGRVVYMALAGNYEDEKNLSGDVRFDRAALGHRIAQDPAAVLDVDEITLIKRLIGRMFGAEIIWQIYPILDPNTKPGKAR
jgi:hypothetical protein